MTHKTKNNVKLKTIDKAYKIYESIKQIDSEIIEIDRIAMLVANGCSKSHFELRVEDLQKAEQEKENVRFDEDGSLMMGFNGLRTPSIWEQITAGYRTGGHFGCESVNLNKHDRKLKWNLSEHTALKVLAVLLSDKKEQRDNLLIQLERLGISI